MVSIIFVLPLQTQQISRKVEFGLGKNHNITNQRKVAVLVSVPKQPRIDPIQLLNCLSVLLSPSGGIKSRDEVQRLASLMTKFSKKLVSKCIYIQILKCTETELLGLFMGSGGWLLVHVWLTESIVAKNWPLVRELLELLLLCPVDIERLKTNNCPKLVKELSKDGNQFDIRALASKLVEQWLKTVKGEQVVPIQVPEISKIISDAHNLINDSIKTEISENIAENKSVIENQMLTDIKKEIADIKDEKELSKDKDDDPDKKDILPVLKISLKDGKKVVSQIDDSDSKSQEGSETDVKEHHKRSLSSSKSKDERSKSSSDKDKSREKEKDDKQKDSSHKTNDKATDEKPESPSIHKLGKIPKLSDVKKEKPSISIEVRKPDEPKPKTVKTFNSRFRKHGLEEEVKPPPSRAALQNKKPPPVLPPSVPTPKRPSPVHNDTPPEKKPKIIESVEKPGAIKLIPPKPKRLHSCQLLFASSSVHNSLGRYYFSVDSDIAPHNAK
ncbi:Pnuts protein [Operophtera brumata]|uniref:Pnuts protein n=1 Tax=Operophtera brumata TaxID=104452 RepID=A0A0L7KU42_OPEBR|nr:Pnuts protein [Operophtera brumata]